MVPGPVGAEHDFAVVEVFDDADDVVEGLAAHVEVGVGIFLAEGDGAVDFVEAGVAEDEGGFGEGADGFVEVAEFGGELHVGGFHAG